MTNPFKVNNYYKDKDKILRALFEWWQIGDRDSRYGSITTDLGRSMSVLKIHEKTTLNREHIDFICISLSNSGHITMFKEDENEKNHLWLITESGRQAIADNFYLNQQGLDNRNLFLQFGGLLVAVLALVVSIFGLFYPKQDDGKTNSKQQQTEQPSLNKVELKDSTVSK